MRVVYNIFVEGYRSGHNGAVLKTVRVKAHGGSNPSPSAKKFMEASMTEVIIGAIIGSISASMFAFMFVMLEKWFQSNKEKAELKFLIRLELERSLKRLKKCKTEISKSSDNYIVAMITDKILFNTEKLHVLLSEEEIKKIELLYRLHYTYEYFCEAQKRNNQAHVNQWCKEFRETISIINENTFTFFENLITRLR